VIRWGFPVAIAHEVTAKVEPEDPPRESEEPP
jgi:hypothetical protein